MLDNWFRLGWHHTMIQKTTATIAQEARNDVRTLILAAVVGVRLLGRPTGTSSSRAESIMLDFRCDCIGIGHQDADSMG
jgi:hypothetical protein